MLYRFKAAKVWCPDEEPEPEGLFNPTTCPGAPSRWFHEAPDLAAELYALERFTSGVLRLRVNVLDEGGETHTFITSTELKAVTSVSRQ